MLDKSLGACYIASTGYEIEQGLLLLISVFLPFYLTKQHGCGNMGPLLMNIKRMATMVHMHEFMSFQFIFISTVNNIF